MTLTQFYKHENNTSQKAGEHYQRGKDNDGYNNVDDGDATGTCRASTGTRRRSCNESSLVPDGRKLAFEINGQTGSIVLFVASIDGGKQYISSRKDGTQSRADLLWWVYGDSYGSTNLECSEQGTFFEGSHKGGSNRLYMYSFNGQPPYPVPENVISGDLSATIL